MKELGEMLAVILLILLAGLLFYPTDVGETLGHVVSGFRGASGGQ